MNCTSRDIGHLVETATVVVVVVVVDAIFQTEPGTRPLSGESEKYALSTKNVPHHHTDPTRELVEIMSVLQGRTARARAQIEASTEHTSPFQQ